MRLKNSQKMIQNYLTQDLPEKDDAIGKLSQVWNQMFWVLMNLLSASNFI